MAEQQQQHPTEKGAPRFSERLGVPLWWYPLPLLGAVLLAAEVHMGYPGVRAWLPYLVTVPLTIGFLLWLGRVRVQIRDDELWVDDAHLPLRFVGEVEVIPPAAKRKAMGPGLDPAAFVVHRPWVGSMVRVHLNDPDDPTPYWQFSTRHPERVAELLRRGPDMR